jgi:hypothetical protein
MFCLTKTSVNPDDPASKEQDDRPKSSNLRDNLPVSKTFKFFMNVQLALILFLPIFWLYQHW